MPCYLRFSLFRHRVGAPCVRLKNCDCQLLSTERSVNRNTKQTHIASPISRADADNDDNSTSNGNRSSTYGTREKKRKKNMTKIRKTRKLVCYLCAIASEEHEEEGQTEIDDESLKSLPRFNWYPLFKTSPADTAGILGACCVCDRGRLIKPNIRHIHRKQCTEWTKY